MGLSVAGFVWLLMLLMGLVDTVEAGVGLILCRRFCRLRSRLGACCSPLAS